MLNLLRRFFDQIFGPHATPPMAPAPAATPAAVAPAPLAPAARPAPAALAAQPAGERDVRARVLNSFLATPHGKLGALAPLHAEGIARDPLFYGHLAAWYERRGEVRDHKVLFAAHLLTSEFGEHREAGWVLLQALPPHMVAAALDHAKVSIGKVPRAFKSAVTSYLRALEASPGRFDRAALRSRGDLKHLYASMRIAPGARAQQVLFDERPPADSPLHSLKLLAKAAEPAEQARLIVEHAIPFTTAVGAVRALSPSVLVALVSAMSPQETINHLAALKRRGAFDSPEVKALIEGKLRAAEDDRRVSTLKATRALASARLDGDTAALLTEVTDKRVAKIARIARPTALFVDKSSSMTEAIGVATEVAALVSAVCSDFRVLAFDTAAFEVRAQGSERSAWERAFKLVRANGSTSIGAALDKLARERHYVEQLVIITDCGENSAPFFRDAYRSYIEALGVGPQITIITVGSVDRGFLRRLEEAQLPVTVWEFGGDYYALPNILSLLAQPTRAELVDEVMAVPLPARGG
jgi:hypothetical protein